MDSLIFIIAPLFQWLTRSTFHASVIVCIVMIVKALLSKRLAPRWHYYLWLLVIARMLMPAAPQSTLSIFNLIPAATEQSVIAEPQPVITQLPQASPASDKDQAEYISQPIIETAVIETRAAKSEQAIAPLPIEQTTAIEATTPIAQKPEATETTDYIAILPLAWLVGAVALALYIFIGNIRLWRIVRQQRPITDSRILNLLEDCKSQMNLHTYLSVVETTRVTSPALFGFMRPRLLLPMGLLEKLTPAQLRHVFLHELAHLKRGDIYLGWLTALLQTIHWFNPIVWLAFHKMRADRELACDQLALTSILNEEPNEYGKTILSLLEDFSGPTYNPGLAGILEDRSQLKRRITMIAKHKKGSYRFSTLAAIVMIVLCAVALTSAKDSTPLDEKKAMANSFADLLIDGKFKLAAADFDKTMSKALPAKRLMKVWKDTTAQAGDFQEKLGTRSDKYLWSDIIYVTCQFEHGPLDIKVVYDRNKKISGLWLTPVPQKVLDEYANQPETTEDPTSSTDSYITTLTNGVMVELISVCKTRDNQRCWTPDGSLLDKAPYYKSGVWAGSKAFEFTFKVNNLDEEQSATSWKIDGQYATGSGIVGHPTDKTGEEITDLWVIDAKIIEGVQKCDISFGVAAGSWQTSAKCVGIEGTVSSKDQHPYTFSQAYIHDNMVCVTVSDDMVKLASRLIAIDINGNTHLSESIKFGSTRGLRQSTFGFKKLKLEDIKEFQFQTQPYEWVYFKNVSLKSNPENKSVNKTASSTGSYIKTLANGVKIELESVSQYPINNTSAWTPAGNLLESPSRTTTNVQSVHPIQTDEQAILFNLKYYNNNGLVKFSPKIENSSYLFWSATRNLILTKLPKSQTICDLKLKVAAGKWKTVAWGGPADREGHTNNSFNDTAVIFYPVTTDKGKVTIKIANQLGGIADCRPVLYDKANKMHEPTYWSNSGSGIYSCESTFDVPQKEIKYFALQARKYETITFKNISLKPKAKTDNPSNITTLPNNVTVELVGICQHPSEGKQWWHPDGSPMKNSPYQKIPYVLNGNGQAFEFFAKASSSGQPFELSSFYIDGAKKEGKTYTPDTNLLPNSQALARAFVLPDNLVKSDVEVGIYLEQWQTMAASKGNDIITLGAKCYSFSEAIILPDGTIKISLAHDPPEGKPVGSDEQRMVAIDKQGNIHKSTRERRAGSAHIEQYQVDFKGITLDEIKEFRFQTRPFHWVTFKNVSLKATTKSDTQIKVLKHVAQLQIPIDASKRVLKALQTISDAMIAGESIMKGDKNLALLAIEFDRINEAADDLQGKNSKEIPDAAMWGHLDTRLIDILEKLHEVEETAEGCRSLATAKEHDYLSKHWQTLIKHYNTLCLYFPEQSAGNTTKSTDGQNANPAKKLQAYLGTWEMVEVKGKDASKLKSVKITFKADGTAIAENTEFNGNHEVNNQQYDFINGKIMIKGHEEFKIRMVNEKLICTEADATITFKKKNTEAKQLTGSDKGQLFSMFITIGTTSEHIGKMLDSNKIDETLQLCKTIDKVWPKMQVIAKDTEFEVVVVAGTDQFRMLHEAVKDKNTELAKTHLKTLVELGNQSADMFMKLMQPESTAKPAAEKARAIADAQAKVASSITENTNTANTLQDYLGTWEMVEVTGENASETKSAKITFTTNGIAISEVTETDGKHSVHEQSYVFRNNKLLLVDDEGDIEGNINISLKNNILTGIAGNTTFTCIKSNSANTNAPKTNLSKANSLPGKLVFHGRYRHRSRGRDIDVPGELWVKRDDGGQINAITRLPWMGTYDIACGDDKHWPKSYVTERDAGNGKPGYKVALEFDDGKALLTRRGIRDDITDKQLTMPNGARFSPNTRPDSYSAANIFLRSLDIKSGQSKDFTVCDWDNSGEALVDYNIRVTNAGKEQVTVPAGTFNANHYILKQLTSADTWFKKRAGHITDFWVLDNNVIVRVLRHREPYEIVLMDYTYPNELEGEIGTPVNAQPGESKTVNQPEFKTEGSRNFRLNLKQGQVFRYRNESTSVQAKKEKSQVDQLFEYRFKVLQCLPSGDYHVQVTIDRSEVKNDSGISWSIKKGDDFSDIATQDPQAILYAYLTDHPVTYKISKFGETVEIVNKDKFIDGFSKFRTDPNPNTEVDSSWVLSSIKYLPMSAICVFPKTSVAINETWQFDNELLNVTYKLVNIEGKVATLSVISGFKDKNITISENNNWIKIDITSGLISSYTSDNIMTLSRKNARAINITSKGKVTRITESSPSLINTDDTKPSNEKTVFLPDCDDKAIMLDLASGELVDLPGIQGPQELIAAIDKGDKGDIIYDTRSLIFLRGASCSDSIPHPAGLSLTIHKIPDDKQLTENIIVKNRQGEFFQLSIQYVNKGGVNMELSKTDKSTAEIIVEKETIIKPGEVSFEKYFPASQSGAAELEKLWNNPKKDTKEPDYIIKTARNGMRLYKGRGNILRWVGNMFVWGKNPQNEKAIELMYHASDSPNRSTYGDAVYFGLSVTKKKTPEILAAMAAVAMKTDDYYNVTGRILWGCRGQKDELMACLDPYLNSENEATREKAKSVKFYFTDSKAFMAAQAKKHEETVIKEQSGNLGKYKNALLTGDAKTRMKTLNEIQSKSVMTIIDESFLDAFAACLKDPDAKVREKAARMIGSKYVWRSGSQNPRAIEMLTGLLRDTNRQVKYAAVYYGLSTVNNPPKELLTKTLATILDDREVNYYGRVIWGAKRNRKAVKEILTEWINQKDDPQKAIKAYEIYEDVMQKPLDEEIANRFSGKKSDAYESLVAMAISPTPIKKNEMIKQFTDTLTKNELLTKVPDLYIMENQQTAVAMFICDNLADRNAIRKVLKDAHGFRVGGYFDGSIGPTGSGWLTSVRNFKQSNEAYHVNIKIDDMLFELRSGVDWKIKEQVIERIVQKGQLVVPTLIQCLRHKLPEDLSARIGDYQKSNLGAKRADKSSFGVQACVKITLEKIGKPAVPLLIESITSQPETAVTVINILGDIADHRATPAIISILSNHSDLWQKVEAARSLEKLNAKQAIPHLIEALNGIPEDQHNNEKFLNQIADSLAKLSGKSFGFTYVPENNTRSKAGIIPAHYDFTGNDKQKQEAIKKWRQWQQNN